MPHLPFTVSILPQCLFLSLHLHIAKTPLMQYNAQRFREKQLRTEEEDNIVSYPYPCLRYSFTTFQITNAPDCWIEAVLRSKKGNPHVTHPYDCIDIWRASGHE